MSAPITPEMSDRPGRLAELTRDADSVSDVLGPLIAGARARGVADACELLGMAAVLIDGTGSVLHAGGRAHRALSPAVRIVEGHLIGSDGTTNEALQRLVAGAIGGAPTEPFPTEITLRAEGSTSEITIRALRFSPEVSDRRQLLKTILIVSDRQV